MKGREWCGKKRPPLWVWVIKSLGSEFYPILNLLSLNVAGVVGCQTQFM